MNSKLVTALTEKYYTNSKDDRNAVNVGDSVNITYRVVMSLKYKRKLSAKEKQDLAKAIEQGKTVEELSESNVTRQSFKGVVIAIKGKGKSKTITVRKVGANQIGVEKIIPLYSPVLENVKILKKGHSRKSKLYYLRDLKGKKALKIKASLNTVDGAETITEE